MIHDPYQFGVLKPEIHERLVADLENFAKDAGIPPRYIYEPLQDLSTVELEYLRLFRQHMVEGDVAGLLYTSPKAKADALFPRLAGALVRNFIRAKVMTLGVLLEHLSARTMPEVACLLVPNFYSPFNESGHIGAWQVSALYDFMMQRQVEGLQTILYAAQPKVLAKDYGTPFDKFLADHYIAVGG